MTEQTWQEKYYIGSRWKSTGGKEFVVYYHGEDNFYAISSSTHLKSAFDINGKSIDRSYAEADLVEPWKEPHKIMVRVNVYPDCSVISTISSREEMIANRDKGCIAYFEREVTEGEGL